MRALSRFVSRCLLLVMLATVFSPSFGWDAVQSMAGHAHDEMSATDAEHAGHHPDAEQPVAVQLAGEDDDCGGCAGHDAAACGDTMHHCCPGHVLGHLPAGVGRSLALMPAPGRDFLPVDAVDRYASRIPDGLERPPRYSAV